MSDMPDWTAWIIGLALAGLFGFFFWHTGLSLFRTTRALVSSIQNWPQTRRAMTEAEAKSGGRYPLWYRAIRVFLVVAMIAFAVLLVWRKLAGQW
jgi:hypothetical protein